MALKRRIKKLSKSEARRVSGTHFLVCRTCQNEEVEVPLEVSAVTCGMCVQRLVDSPLSGLLKVKRPRGWNTRMYFEQNGEVYSRGVLVTDLGQIEELKSLHGSIDQ